MQVNNQLLDWVFIFTNPLTGEPTQFMCKVTQQQIDLLEAHTQNYNNWFSVQFDRACPQFDDKLNALKLTLEDFYRNVPTKKDFIDWFISEIGAFKMEFTNIPIAGKIINVSLRIVTLIDKEIPSLDDIHGSTLIFGFHDYKALFTPQVMDEHLHKYCQMVRERQIAINQKLTLSLNPATDKAEDKDKKDVRTPHNFELINVFEDTSKYVKIRDILVNKTYLEPITFIWKDTSNGHKSTLINIIKTLHLKGFFQNSHVITNEFCIDLIKNTYGIEVGISTAEKVKPNLDFIPYSTTIQ